MKESDSKTPIKYQLTSSDTIKNLDEVISEIVEYYRIQENKTNDNLISLSKKFSFCNSEQVSAIKSLINSENLIDTVVYIGEYPKINDFTPVIVAVINEYKMFKMVNPVLLSLNSERNIVDKHLIYDLSTSLNNSGVSGDTLKFSSQGYFILPQKDKFTLYAKPKEEYKISKNKNFQSPDSTFVVNYNQKIESVITINSKGKIKIN